VGIARGVFNAPRAEVTAFSSELGPKTINRARKERLLFSVRRLTRNLSPSAIGSESHRVLWFFASSHGDGNDENGDDGNYDCDEERRPVSVCE
jgi:hypothetical protein